MHKPVYRLEDAQGHVPFHGEQACMRYLTPHYDPKDLFTVMGLPQDFLEGLTNAGLVFGWRTQAPFRQFFKRGGQTGCRKLGFDRCVFRPTLRLDLPDGQVMFLREPLDPNDRVHQALAILLGSDFQNQSIQRASKHIQVLVLAVVQGADSVPKLRCPHAPGNEKGSGYAD